MITLIAIITMMVSVITIIAMITSVVVIITTSSELKDESFVYNQKKINILCKLNRILFVIFLVVVIIDTIGWVCSGFMMIGHEYSFESLFGSGLNFTLTIVMEVIKIFFLIMHNKYIKRLKAIKEYSAASAVRYCMHCGTKISADMRFCINCGTPVGDVKKNNRF